MVSCPKANVARASSERSLFISVLGVFEARLILGQVSTGNSTSQSCRVVWSMR